jgi:hypothetical protein
MPAVKVTVNLTPSDLATLEDLADDSSITKTQALRRSIATHAFVAQAQRQHRKILVESSPGRFREVAFPV